MNLLGNTQEALENLKIGAFLTVKNGSKVNTMTIGWGSIGYMWEGKPYFTVMVRPSRYTFDLIKDATDFTVSIPVGTLSEELKICGTKSGRDMDKGEVVKFENANKTESPIVSGCQMYYECKIETKSLFTASDFSDEIKESIYKDKRYHGLFFGKIMDYYER